MMNKLQYIIFLHCNFRKHRKHLYLSFSLHSLHLQPNAYTILTAAASFILLRSMRMVEGTVEDSTELFIWCTDSFVKVKLPEDQHLILGHFRVVIPLLLLAECQIHASLTSLHKANDPRRDDHINLHCVGVTQCKRRVFHRALHGKNWTPKIDD